MQISRVLTLSLVTASLCCVVASAAQGQPTSAPTPNAMQQHPNVPHASALVNVSACHAALNIQQSGGWYGYPGYSYGWRGGYWGDPWGANYYQPPVTTAHPQLGIDYTNISPKVMSEIQFGLIANGILKAEVRDVGKFSPHAEIKHKFGIPASTFPIGTGLPQCVPLHIVFEDGTKWRNPNLPPKNQHIYMNP
ncbi:MAG: hypothetical protein JO194_06380 [Candidatus Eremiobacteraeota bacterium]|nr:hypothetical protein [Candidatus Eremiobacteraeota bacterium]